MNIEEHLRMAEQQELAPAIVEEAADEYDTEDLAEICAAVEETVKEESMDRGVGKHGGIACLYMVVNRLADPGEVDA